MPHRGNDLIRRHSGRQRTRPPQQRRQSILPKGISVSICRFNNAVCIEKKTVARL